VQGFIALWDYADRIPEAHEEVGRLYREGKVVLRLHEIAGIENALNALNMMFSGGNTGKLMIKVSA
jgi:NADPH-dependent curcumin reductase